MGRGARGGVTALPRRARGRTGRRGDRRPRAVGGKAGLRPRRPESGQGFPRASHVDSAKRLNGEVSPSARVVLSTIAGESSPLSGRTREMRKRPIFLLITGALLAVLPAYAGWDEGVAAFKAGNFAQAVKEFEALAAANPEQAQVQVMLGRSLLKTNRAAQAVTALRKAYALNPMDVAPQIFPGQAYVDSGRAGEAVPLLGRVNTSSPPAAQQQAFSAIYSEALTKSGQGDRAAAELRKLAAAKPNDADIQYQYGAMAFNEIGRAHV